MRLLLKGLQILPAGINDYLRKDLKFPLSSPYNIFGEITKWPKDSDGSTFGVISELGSILAHNPKLNVMIASGYFDLACPMAAVEYELSQVPGGPTIRSRISQTRYFGGHMMYINPTALEQLKANVSTFILKQSGVKAPALPALQ